jgi:hypothetical protein
MSGAATTLSQPARRLSSHKTKPDKICYENTESRDIFFKVSCVIEVFGCILPEQENGWRLAAWHNSLSVKALGKTWEDWFSLIGKSAARTGRLTTNMSIYAALWIPWRFTQSQSAT